jgi:hypothetical protein
MTLSGLQIAPLTAELTGEYTVVAVNRLGRASSTVPVRMLPGNVLPNAPPITSGAFQAFDTPQNQAPGIAGVTPPSKPTFILSPRAVEAVAGATVQLDGDAAGFPRPTFQWYKDGRPIAAMTQRGLRIGPLTAELGGSYVLVATNGSGQAISEPAQVTLISAPGISRQPAGTTLREGDRLRLEVIAVGTAPLSYQWARDGQPIAGAVMSILELPGVSRTNAGVYTVDIRNSAGSVRSEPAVLTVQTKPALTNLSVRTTLAAGQIVTVGAVVEGAAKRVLARAGGPALQQFGLRGTPDPKLELYLRGASPAAANDDWSATLATSFAAVGAFAFPSGSKDAALAQDLAGAFTVQARGTDPGAVLVELYDLGDAGSGRFVNVSVRNRVGTGPDVLIAGLAIGGTGTMNVLIRAIGPGLQPFGVSGTLVDPRLQVHDRTGAAVASNEDWSAALSPTFATTGAFALPANSKDAALLASLRAGETYTVIVSGADGGTGEALIEIYALP